jgi:16S rRNA (cytidine1402-2'-O)-methyltransferase
MVTALPGASSVLSALNVAGLPTDRFFFEGFLPNKSAARRTRIAALASIEATLVLFESGPRIGAALQDLAGIIGARDAAICREMTKLHEEIARGTLAALAAKAGEMETRGEFVIVIGPPAEDAARMSDAELDHALDTALAEGSLKTAVAEIAEVSGRSRREVYARALERTRSRDRTRQDKHEAADGDQ